jgi:hypothetical protein
MWRRKDDEPRTRDEQPHPYRSGFGHASYCIAVMPSGIHCGRRETDAVHIVDPRNPLRRRS